MHSLPRRIGVLGGIVVFCGALLLGLLRDYRPLVAVRKAALSGALLAALTWSCTHIAVSVVRDGSRRRHSDNKT